MTYLFIALAGVTAYLLGSIPTAVWYGQAHFGIDIREHGSGNAGATNTFRVLGKRAGTAVMLIDILKGWLATSLALMLFYVEVIPQEQRITFKLIFGILALIGHILPIFAGFKGGKGVATLLGMALSLHPEAALLCIAIFLFILITFKYVSLGSMLATLAFPVSLALRMFGPEEKSLIIFGFVLFALIVFTHQKNLRKLMQGKESRMYLFKRKQNR
jgi:acyl phosphate:glycerol-3-phosphate acyltransferase